MALIQVSKTVLRLHHFHSKILFEALKPRKAKSSNVCTSYLRSLSDDISRFHSTNADGLKETPEKESEEIVAIVVPNKPLDESENLWTKHVKVMDAPLTKQRTRQRHVHTERKLENNNAGIAENGEQDAGFTADLSDVGHDVDIVPKTEDSMDIELKPIQKHVVQEEFHLSAYVNQSQTLSELVKLGVDLNRLQEVAHAAEFIIKLDFERDIKPYVLFLHDIGIPDSGLGSYISRNPFIFRQSMENLNIRINYLESKKFVREDIVRIVSKCNIFLLVPVKQVDAKLGYFQREYKLSGDELRSIIVRQPKLITWNIHLLKDIRFYIKEFLGFTEPELKQLLVMNPKMFLANKYGLGKRFDLLHNTMNMSHDRLAEWPKVFNSRPHVVQQRHQYLLKVERAQYDPSKENYVSLEAIAAATDKDFCRLSARTSVIQYNNFLKSI